MFGKRPSQPLPAFTIPVPKDGVVDGPDASHDLISTIVNFVNHLLTYGFYRLKELPPHLAQLYHADFYVTQIDNGGHSQFSHNCGARAQFIFANAEAGLAAMGATGQASLMRELAAWTAANPDRASAQTGFKEGREPALDKLDDAFSREQAENPVAPRAAAWIRSWSEIRFIEPVELRAAWNRCAQANPNRSHRVSKARIEGFRQTLSDSVHLGIGMAADAADEVLFEGRNSEAIDVEGRHMEAWIVRTSYGLRGAICNSNGVRLYALQLAGKEVTWKAVSLIGSAGKPDVDRMLSFVKGEPLAAAADLSLSRARPDLTDCTIQFCEMVGDIPNPILKIVVGDEIFMLSRKNDGYFLVGQKPGEIYGAISLAEIAAHEEGLRDH